MTDILYEYANNEKGELINASTATTAGSFFCPECNGEMVLHKAGKGANSHRSHFQHKFTNPECSSESYLHYIFKLKLESVLKSYLRARKPFYIKWTPDFYEERTCNLLKTTIEIVHEKKIKSDVGNSLYQPDISLINAEGKKYVAIEIVVSHFPEPKTLDFYSENKIFLLQIQLDPNSLYSINHIEEIASRPNIFTFTAVSKDNKSISCNLCGKERKIATFKFGKIACHRCNSPVKFPWIEWVSKAKKIMHTGIENFNIKEIEFARSNGCVISKRISKSKYHITYYTVECPCCGETINMNIDISKIHPQSNYFDWYFCPNCHSPSQIKKYKN